MFLWVFVVMGMEFLMCHKSVKYHLSKSNYISGHFIACVNLLTVYILLW